ncbi:MAG: hypothetical protein LH479_03910 [Polaromonas sp.]|nr:hypothetical protein [Polaromonas sp.]
MDVFMLINHLLNFAAPAAAMAVLLVLPTRPGVGLFKTNRPVVQSIWAQTAIVFIASVLILAGGLAVFGRDGKMLTYAALVAGAALCQWVLIRGWSK